MAEAGTVSDASPDIMLTSFVVMLYLGAIVIARPADHF
jgi:hypothetical protein